VRLKACEKFRFVKLLQIVQGFFFQMIIMIMTDQNNIDWRKILNFTRSLSESLGPIIFEWRTSLPKYWINQDIGLVSYGNDCC